MPRPVSPEAGHIGECGGDHSDVAIPLLPLPGQGADLKGKESEEVQEEVRGEEVVFEDHPGVGFDSFGGREGRGEGGDGREEGREEGRKEGREERVRERKQEG